MKGRKGAKERIKDCYRRPYERKEKEKNKGVKIFKVRNAKFFRH
jgi:hypothetical protein